MKLPEVMKAIEADPSKEFDSFNPRTLTNYTIIAEEHNGERKLTLLEHDFSSSYVWDIWDDIPHFIADFDWEERTE